MLAFALVGFAGVVGVARTARGRHLRQSHRHVWQRAANDFGLTWAHNLDILTGIHGRIGELSISVKEAHNPQIGDCTHIVIRAPGIPPDVRMGRESAFLTMVAGQDVQLHDESFDRTVRIFGDPVHVYALMSTPVRERIMEYLLFGDLHLENGQLRLTVPGQALDYDILRGRIEDSVKLAHLLSMRPADIPARLRVNATDGRYPDNCLQNLGFLLQRFVTRPESDDASRALLSSSDARMRFQAAAFLEDLEVVSAIVGDVEAPVAMRIEATRFLITQAPAQRSLSVLHDLLRPGPLQLRCTAAAGLAQVRDLAAVPWLLRALGGLEPELNVAVATALGELGDVRAESAVLRLLQHSEVAEKLAAIQALGKLGTAAAVEPLLAYAEAFAPSALKDAARQSIAAIQARLGDVAAGRLSLADGRSQEGQLSLATDGGTLSLAPEDASQPPTAAVDAPPGAVPSAVGPLKNQA